MTPSQRRFLVLLLCALGLTVRFWQAHRSFTAQASVFPQAQKGTFRAWVAEEPEVLFDHEPGSHDTGRLGGRYQSSVKEVRTVCSFLSMDDQDLPPIKVRCTFRLSPGLPQPLLSYGETLEVQGKVQRPPSASNPGQFDYAHYLKTKGVAYVLYAPAGQWKGEGSSGQHGNFLLRWSYGLKRTSQDILYRFLPFPENALLDGILLGERGPLSGEMVESFLVTSTVHILAVSGMGTAFIAGILFLFFRALQLDRKWAAAAGLAGLLFFVLMTGAHPPACRAGFFSGLALLAVLLERKVRGGTLLLATAILLALMDPIVLEDLSFQISFLATAGLMVLTPWFMERASRVWAPAALLSSTTAAAQVSVWCLIVYSFNQLSPYSILANLVIVPLALFASAGGFVLILGSFLHPALGEVFGAACEVPLELLALAAERIAGLPGASVVAASPPAAWVLLFHLLLLSAFLLYWPSPEPKAPSALWMRRQDLLSKGRKVLRAGGAVFVLASTVGWAAAELRPQPLRVAFLSVGHGNAVVVRSPKGQVLVCDAGRQTRGPDRYHPLVAYLRHEGIGKVQAVLNTHPDQDHVGGLVNLCRAYPVGKAFAGSGADAGSRVYRTFQGTLQARGVTLIPLKSGDVLEGMGPAGFSILHPSSAYRPRTAADNNRSVVSLVSYGGFSFILPGDLEREGIQELLKDKPFSKVDWLMAPHHGRRSGEPALCAQGFHPRFVVLSDWRDYPQTRAIFQAEVPEAVVLSTASEGAVEVEVMADGKGRYRTFREGVWRSFLAGKVDIGLKTGL